MPEQEKTCGAYNSFKKVACERAEGHDGAHANFTAITTLTIAWDIERGWDRREG